MRLDKTLIVAALCATSSLSAGNLLFNSSFELGEAGWSAFAETSSAESKLYDLPKTWGIDDKDARFGGKSFKLWNNAPETPLTIAVLSSHDFLVEEGKSYAVSFWAKSSKSGTKLTWCVYSNQRLVRRDQDGKPLPDVDFNNCSKDVETRLAKDSAELTSEWKRLSFSFTPEKGMTAYALWLSVRDVGAFVHVDGVQVEEGPLTDYKPKTGVEAAETVSKSLYEKGEAVDGAVEAISYFQDKELALELTLFDAFFERTLQKKSVALSLKKGVAERKPFDFKDLPCGAFCVWDSLQPRSTPPGFATKWDEQPECLNFNRLRRGDESYQSAAQFVVVAPPEKRAGEGFLVGVNGPFDNHVSWRATTNEGSVAEIVRFLKLSGCDIVRSWDPAICKWSAVEPQKGVFVWDGDEKRIESAERAGVKVMCVLGGNLLNRKNACVPDWAQKRDRSGSPDGTAVVKEKWLGKKGERHFMPQLEDWRNYVAAVAKRFKGRIACYEILNESDLYLPPEIYMEYMTAASEEIRKADPAAKIQGICSTSDQTVDPNASCANYIGKCLALGADSSMDLISFHPYASLDDSKPVGQPESRRKMADNLAKLGVKAKLWNSEAYYPISSWKPMTNYAGRGAPENVARLLLVDMGEGLAGSTPFHDQGTLCSSPLHPFMNVAETNKRLSFQPDARFAILAATTRFISGAEPVRRIDLPEGGLACIFRKQGKVRAALWNACAAQPAPLTLAKNPSRAFDVMGNPLSLNSSTLELSSKPVYLEWDGGADEAIAAIEGALKPVQRN